MNLKVFKVNLFEVQNVLHYYLLHKSIYHTTILRQLYGHLQRNADFEDLRQCGGGTETPCKLQTPRKVGGGMEA